VRLTLDAHSLEEIDRRGVAEEKARARAERAAPVGDMRLDEPALAAFLAELRGATRDDLTGHGFLLATARQGHFAADARPPDSRRQRPPAAR
jgi:hypothetical protein